MGNITDFIDKLLQRLSTSIIIIAFLAFLTGNIHLGYIDIHGSEQASQWHGQSCLGHLVDNNDGRVIRAQRWKPINLLLECCRRK